ncbi:diacylglyceryl transferase [Gramella jeungdoensis]|uniref:Diacylglyceryl transferase n=1 Tax=Gramella jeungdoensis TaxID=708091 RepID=A0ABT0Z3D1_9FLAO|nr:DUF6787 family protein [Gramella jeungdoensis]MCM8570243.1 diacylglyceryl transferase [Gramella jeungdoensis]
MKKLKNRWGIDSNWQLFIIFLVFAITGSSAAKLASPLCESLGITQESTHWSLYWFARIFLIFPIYQVLLVTFGWIFGQFQFFWAFEKKMLSRIGFARIFRN